MRRHLPKSIFFALAFLTAGSALAAATPEDVNRATALASEKDLARRPEWQALLHMHRDVLFRWRSSIDDPSFFLHPRGRFDAHAELTATVKAFVTEEVIEGEPVACRYPARYDWLATQMELPPAPVCERFEGWRQKLAPTDVSMIFSSYYLNNPASIYGHTFLKLARSGYEPGGGLLDYTVNYAATTNTRNGILFAVKGLLGGYDGRFSTEPYYVKIQQYNNVESRDLWEYKLNLGPEAVDRLVKHLWELGPAAMTYYFFNKNCSYQLLPLLDASEPRLNLARGFKFRAIPLDTLRSVLESPGLVTESRLRPSHVRVMLARRELLSESEIALAEMMVVDLSSTPVSAVDGLPARRKALVLDSAFDLLRYRAGFYRNQPEDVKERERRILELRRSIPPAEAGGPPSVGEVPGPHDGHETGRLGLYAGGDEHARFQEFSVRASIHDLEADPTGFVEGSQLEMFNVRGRHQAGPGVYLEEFKLFEIISLAPWDRWVHPPSWTVRAHTTVARDLEQDPERSLVTSLDGGSGFAWGAGGGDARVVAYAMWKADFETGHVLEKGHRGGMAAHAGVLGRLGRIVRLHLYGTATRFFTGAIGNRVEITLTPSVSLTNDFEVRGNLRRVDGHQEASAGLNYYW